MKITLLRTGGLLPITKKAEQEVKWTEEEITSLLNLIKANDQPGQARDNTNYTLKYSAGTFPIQWEKIPAEYLETFNGLKEKLMVK
jgi:hypothetical protein